MKKKAGVWIDGSRAIVINFSGKNHYVVEIESGMENRVYHDKEGDHGAFMGTQHIGNEKTFDARRQNKLKKFLEDVLFTLKDADDIYIFGPGETKTHLKLIMADSRKFQKLFGKLRMVEVADSMTRNQMIAQVRKFYGL